MKNMLDIKTRKELHAWLVENYDKEKECWLIVKKGKVRPDNAVWYLDSVEEALCFGWIDSINKNVNGINLQKFSPRSKKSVWTELNKERCRRLEKLGLMTDAGRKVLPDMSESGFVIDKDVLHNFIGNQIAWENFNRFPLLYRKVRIDTIQRVKKNEDMFWQRLKKLIEKSEQNEMFGDWNDNGRLLNY
ncbi:MAG: YdeI/OmpD-associated family protein [Prevotellaceae bacterium]|jgi:uncharacterized protein YdeI (YjbR/CyaY-like superfamily)|nr:YdeI/OmpD-associated family protein [Prevotellaceae bacterium]